MQHSSSYPRPKPSIYTVSSRRSGILSRGKRSTTPNMKTTLACLLLVGVALAYPALDVSVAAGPGSFVYDSRFLGWSGNGFAVPAVAPHGLVAPAVTAPRLAPPSHAGPAAGGLGSPGYQNRLLASAIARHNTPWGAIGHGHTLRYGPHYYQ
ncbi:unnamed protein product [Nezara viridula]|uniref:Uncharacterized protein n=1 Tax=Nezara viridula TaxID=85310 RepID=A0A9P0HI48_NEZVI|nr:unnamed protein product [Nezara viridula]